MPIYEFVSHYITQLFCVSVSDIKIVDALSQYLFHGISQNFSVNDILV